MPKKFKYEKPVGQPMDPDKDLVKTDMRGSPFHPQPAPRLNPGDRQAQGRIDLPAARKAVKALHSASQNYFKISKGKTK